MRLRSFAGLLLVVVLACSCAANPPAASPASKSPPAVAAPAGPRPLDSWANGAVFYEVFVRSFQDSNGDGKGDIPGLISKLDYLKDLGVDALWLMPVFASPSYHGYDTTDYENINPDYGTNADFERLCAEVHKRGMRLIVDLVLNHTSDKHPWFIESASSPTSPKRDWYVWKDSNPGWGQPWNPSGQSWYKRGDAFYYAVFWSGMPDLNFRNPEVRAEAQRIVALWLGRGLDGFRLDATRHLIETGGGAGQSDTTETHAYLKELSAFVRKTKPDAALVGENWTDVSIIAEYYGDTAKVPGGDELPLSFSFPLAARIIAAARQGEASLVGDQLTEMQKVYPPFATWVPFLTNHDMKRVATNLGKDAAKLRSAAGMLLTLPGTPFLYYGEEIGLENGPGDDDEWKRTPMPWDGTKTGGFTTGKPWNGFAPGREQTNVAAQAKDPTSLLSTYKRLLAARHASRALQRGRLELLASDGPILAYRLTEGAERVLVVHNLGNEEASAALALAGATVAASILAPEAAKVSPDPAGTRVALPAHTTGIWQLK